jgi:hypothetical protein
MKSINPPRKLPIPVGASLESISKEYDTLTRNATNVFMDTAIATFILTLMSS